MLINWETNELNIGEFKKFISQIQWVKKPRIIGERTEMWYRGDYEDSDKVVKVVIRPTMRMQVTESFKERLQNGTAPNKGQKPTKSSPFVDFGSTVTVLVDSKFVEKIDKLANEFKKKPTQTVSWS